MCNAAASASASAGGAARRIFSTFFPSKKPFCMDILLKDDAFGEGEKLPCQR